MRQLVLLATLATLGTPVLSAQQRQFQPPPDHWLTLDSLMQSVGITPDQQAAVAEHYAAVDSLMKAAARQRQTMRASMQGQRPAPGDPRFAAMREQFAQLQTALDEHYNAIRASLNAEQQERFDALPKPQVMGRRPGMRRP